MDAWRSSHGWRRVSRHFVCCAACYGLVCQGPVAQANDGKRAVETIAEIAARESGLDKAIVKKLEQTIPDGMKEILIPVAPVVKVLIDRRIEFKWEF